MVMVFSCLHMQHKPYRLPRHNAILSVLHQFNTDFLVANRIAFGGGTRIALELDEYRESVDIDFLCPDRNAYRAVREQVTNVSLGQLVKRDFVYLREIKFDRYGVRTFIRFDNTDIKLEIVSCDQYDLSINPPGLFPVPYLSKNACFYTKLLAHTDRPMTEPFKDIFDLLMMHKYWGKIPEDVWAGVDAIYSKAVLNTLVKAVNDVISNPQQYVDFAIQKLRLTEPLATTLVYDDARVFLDSFP